MNQQLDLVERDPRKVSKGPRLAVDVKRFLAALAREDAVRSPDGWVDTRWMAGALELTPRLSISNARRFIRHYAEHAGGEVLSRSHDGGGYKLTRKSTEAEVKRAVANYRARANKEMGRASDTERVFYVGNY